jgi:hypothetical protein
MNGATALHEKDTVSVRLLRKQPLSLLHAGVLTDHLPFLLVPKLGNGLQLLFRNPDTSRITGTAGTAIGAAEAHAVLEGWGKRIHG